MNWLINWLNGKLKFHKIVKEKEEMSENCEKLKVDIGTTMSNRERKELTERIKGMSQEELLIVSETIPVDLCLARIQKELDKAKSMEESIKKLSGMMFSN